MKGRRGIGTMRMSFSGKDDSLPSCLREFESPHPLHAPLTQLAEYRPLKSGVGGSIPSRRTTGE